MRFTWFNLMPWPHLPDDFREKNRSVWVDIPNTLYDPSMGHHVYHEYMDQLEYAEALGFDGIGVNEHHQNGYGLMPSPNLMAAGLARRTARAALCVIGNRSRSTTRRSASPKRWRCSTCSPAAGSSRLPGRHADGHAYPTADPALREKYHEAHDLIIRAWTARGAVRLQRQVQPAPLRQLLAAARPEAAPADLDPRRRLRRDLRLLPRLRLLLLLPVVLRLSAPRSR